MNIQTHPLITQKVYGKILRASEFNFSLRLHCDTNVEAYIYYAVRKVCTLNVNVPLLLSYCQKNLECVKGIFTSKFSGIFYFINIRLLILTCGQNGRQYERHTNTPKLNRRIFATLCLKRAEFLTLDLGVHNWRKLGI